MHGPHLALVSAKLTFRLPPVEMPPFCFRGLCLSRSVSRSDAVQDRKWFLLYSGITSNGFPRFLTKDKTWILISDIRSSAANKNQQAVHCSDAVQDRKCISF